MICPCCGSACRPGIKFCEGQMTNTRDINAARNSAKRQIMREHPDRFCLDGKVLRWASDREERPREKLSTAGQRKLAALAAREGMTPDELLSRLISARRNAKGEGREALIPARRLALENRGGVVDYLMRP